MSDGPYKSLPMKRRWRRAAKCAYQEAYSSEEVTAAVTSASHADWRAEVRHSLATAVAEAVSPSGQQALFTDQALRDLRALRCASPLEASFICNAVDAVQCGLRGAEAVQAAAEGALSDRLLCNYRQVEEHVYRDDGIHSARFMRRRFEAAHAQVDLSGLARAALRAGNPLPRRSRAAHTDLDAGVSL